jgi:hypothetical protein
MGIEEYADLTHIYFGWFDDWSGQIYNYDRDQFASGLPGLHTMYVGDETDYGPGWLPAWEEIELSVAGSDLAQNTSGKIDYAAFAGSHFNAQGYFDISSCLNAPDYEVGMECKLMFSGDQWASYFPPRNEIEPEDNTVSDESIDEPVDPTAEPISEPTSEQPTSTENASEQPNNSHGEIGNNDAPTIEVVSQAQVLAEPIKAPNTGTMTNPCSQKTIEFPWWLIIVIALGNTIILWLFRPQKYHKSFKKGLDKKAEVR